MYPTIRFRKPVLSENRPLLILLIFVIILIDLFLIVQIVRETQGLQNLKKDMFILEQKNIAFIIAFRDFRDEEYFTPKKILENAGGKIKTISTQQGTAIGADGGEVKTDILIQDLNPENFDAIVFIGGPGCLKELDNENSYKVIQNTILQNRVLASICISPVILARAGVLQGKKATVWSSPMDKSAVKILKQAGAVYQDDSVVVDGKIITGNGPAAAKEFGEKIIEALTP